jgi:hypothetical protein
VDTFRSVPTGRKSLDFQIKRLAPGWKPPRVRGKVWPINHYPCVNLGTPVFSAYAAGRLGEFLRPNGELLPVVTDCGEFLVYNLTTIADVLDVARSEIDWLKEPITAGVVRHYEFKADSLDRLRIFRLPQKPSQVYVTEEFVNAAVRWRLTGMRFTRVWPVARGAKGEVKQVLVGAGASAGTSPAGTVEEAMRESVFLDLSYDCACGGGEEAFRRLEDNLRSRLDPPSPAGFAVGHLEHSDNEDNYRRLVFSCPDADALARVLSDWVDEVRFGCGVRIIRREGPFDNVEVKESEVRSSLGGD